MDAGSVVPLTQALEDLEHQIALTEAAHAAVGQELRQQVQDRDALIGRLLVVRRDEVNATLDVATRHERARAQALRDLGLDLDAAAAQIEAYADALRACRTAIQALHRAVEDARVANGWGYDDPAYRRHVPRDRWAAVRDGEAVLAYVRAGQRGVTPSLRQCFRDALAQIATHGYGDGYGFPCCSCGEAMTDYDDEYYSCRFC